MNAAVKHPYQEIAERALLRAGGFYTFSDVLAETMTGNFQMFSNGNSVAVTRLAVFPRKTALEVVFMVGNNEELRELEKEIIEFAETKGVDTMYALGRSGFTKKAFEGWRQVASLFLKEIHHG